MSFNNIEQIKDLFHLTETDPEELRKQLRQLQIDLHPDKNGGEFASDDEREKYLKIGEAIQFLDNNSKVENTALVPISEFTELVKVIRDLVPTNQVTVAETKLSGDIDHRINRLGSRYLAPKITLATITAITTAVWLFPSTISEHPVLKRLIDVTSPEFAIIWLMILAFSAGFWIIIGGLESKQKQFQTRLKTESYQNRLFERFLNNIIGESFTKDDFIIFLRTNGRSRLPDFQSTITSLFIRPNEIDVELAQSLADVIFARAESRGVIEKDNEHRGLSEVFILK